MTHASPTPAESTRLVQRLRRRYADQLQLLPPGAPNPERLAQGFAALQPHYPELGDSLRVLRQAVTARLVALDCEQHAPLSVVTQAMTWLAEFTLAQAQQAALNGSPCATGCRNAQMANPHSCGSWAWANWVQPS